jgi:hypothetical protein
MDALTPAAITAFRWTGDPEAAQAAVDRLSRTVFHIGADRIVAVPPDGRPTLVGTLAADGTFRATAADAEATGVLTSAAATTAVVVTWRENAGSYRATAALRPAVNPSPFEHDRAEPHG